MKNELTTQGIRYVRQEEHYGCVIACMAMILGRTYQDVKSVLPKDKGGRFGLDYHDVLSFMWTQGYIGLSQFQCESHTQLKRERSEWVKPYAPVNIVAYFKPDTKASHALLWLRDGRVYDPNREGLFTIDEIPDIHTITSLWKLSEITRKELPGIPSDGQIIDLSQKWFEEKVEDEELHSDLSYAHGMRDFRDTYALPLSERVEQLERELKEVKGRQSGLPTIPPPTKKVRLGEKEKQPALRKLIHWICDQKHPNTDLYHTFASPLDKLFIVSSKYVVPPGMVGGIVALLADVVEWENSPGTHASLEEILRVRYHVSERPKIKTTQP